MSATAKVKPDRLIDRLNLELPADARASRSSSKQSAQVDPRTQRVNAGQSRTAVDNFIKDQDKKIRQALVLFSKDKDIRSTADINTFCDFFYSLHYEEIKNIIEAETINHYQEIFTKEDTSGVINILNIVEKRLRTLLNTTDNRDIILLELEKQNPSISKELIKNSFPESVLNEIFSNIINKLIYEDMQPVMLETLKHSFRQKICTETTPSGYTALHLACKANNVPLAKTLIKTGWQNIATDKAPEPTFLADPKISAELLAFINKSGKALSIPRGGEGLIAFRGDLLPMPIKVGIRVNGKDYPAESFSKNIRLILRTPTKPVPGEPAAVTTPKKTKLIRSATLTFNKDNVIEMQHIEVMLEPNFADKKIAKVSHAKQNVPPGLKANHKFNSADKTSKTFVTTITPEILATWARIGEDKSRNQGQVMGNISAGAAAQAAGFLNNDNNKWEWCHLIAHSMGGEGGQVPKIPSDCSRMGPQRETNLVVGTAEANSQMIVIESVVKDLINHHKIPSLCLKVKPTFVKGLEAYHIAEKLEYTIQDHPDNPTHQVTVEFDMLSRQKVFPGQLEITSTLLVQDFLASKKLKAAKGKSSDKSTSPAAVVADSAIATSGSKAAPVDASQPDPQSVNITVSTSAKQKVLQPKKYQAKAEVAQQLGWNCFDIAAGIARNDLVNFAIINKDWNGGKLKKLLAPEIKNALTLTLIFLNYRQALENANEEEAIRNAKNIQNLFHKLDSIKDVDAKAKLEIKLHQLLAKSDQMTPTASKVPVPKPTDGSKNTATKKPIEYTGFLAELKPYILPEAMLDNPIIKTMLEHLANYQAGHERMPAEIRTLFTSNPLAAGAIRARYNIAADRMPTLEQIDEFVQRNADVLYRDRKYENFCSAYTKVRYECIGRHEEALNNGCASDAVYTTYINQYYGNQEWVAFQRNLRGEQSTSIVDIVAIKENAKIVIVDQAENEMYNTQRTVPNPVKDIYIQYNGHNHFIGIERIDQQLHRSPQRPSALSNPISPGLFPNLAPKPDAIKASSVVIDKPLARAADPIRAEYETQKEIDTLNITRTNLLMSIAKIKSRESSSIHSSPGKSPNKIKDFESQLEKINEKIQALEKRLSTVVPTVLRPDSTLVTQLARQPLNLTPLPAHHSPQSVRIDDAPTAAGSGNNGTLTAFNAYQRQRGSFLTPIKQVASPPSVPTSQPQRPSK